MNFFLRKMLTFNSYLQHEDYNSDLIGLLSLKWANTYQSLRGTENIISFSISAVTLYSWNIGVHVFKYLTHFPKCTLYQKTKMKTKIIWYVTKPEKVTSGQQAGGKTQVRHNWTSSWNYGPPSLKQTLSWLHFSFTWKKKSGEGKVKFNLRHY